ncbi:MAG: type II toxin-antitoxin system VapC family toxin [Acidobacteria bacterium]|nr:type II toxin-antitoxin system VapC family toxin [Acidobacteriota bacterium]MXZ70808.1 type II toxin-antitoxin system VapC family toxin [Acidobacteriota bacterium]MYD69445.1 type II toxin-antitoxin system VapC family toxin [Acidobacteriota bacterium]MYJ04521.1 type II toxin-antitoxin system VapC family toxin [Acidobacteriota bacterium]
MRAVDTNVLVRLLARDDPEQVSRAEAFVARGAWVPLLVLAEAVWVLDSVYGLNRKRIGTVVDMLIEHDRLTLQDEDVVRRAHSMFERERSIGFSDCLVVEAARKAGHVPVGTFDRKMARLDGTHRL